MERPQLAGIPVLVRSDFVINNLKIMLLILLWSIGHLKMLFVYTNTKVPIVSQFVFDRCWGTNAIFQELLTSLS